MYNGVAGPTSREQIALYDVQRYITTHQGILQCLKRSITTDKNTVTRLTYQLQLYIVVKTMAGNTTEYHSTLILHYNGDHHR